MSLKNRILREMVVDPRAIKIFNELPTELKTRRKLDEIQARLRVLNGGAERMTPKQLPKKCLRIECMGYAFDSEGGEMCDDSCYSQTPCPAGIADNIRWNKELDNDTENLDGHAANDLEPEEDLKE